MPRTPPTPITANGSFLGVVDAGSGMGLQVATGRSRGQPSLLRRRDGMARWHRITQVTFPGATVHRAETVPAIASAPHHHHAAPPSPSSEQGGLGAVRPGRRSPLAGPTSSRRLSDIARRSPDCRPCNGGLPDLDLARHSLTTTTQRACAQVNRASGKRLQLRSRDTQEVTDSLARDAVCAA